jgi:HD-GYP domain-containing protein (c-di-GMP phosphodiesterase class II)
MVLPENPVTAGRKLFTERASELGVGWWMFNSELKLVQIAGETGGPSVAAVPSNVLQAAGAVRCGRSMVEVAANNGKHLLSFPYPDGVVVVVELSEGAGVLSRAALTLVLNNYHRDLNCIAEDQRAIEGFNVQLSQSYEEVNLIFRMARLLTGGKEPAAVVQTMGDELREVMRYGWVAIVLDNASTVLSELRGLTTVSGLPPFSKSYLSSALQFTEARDGSMVLVPGKSELANCAGTEVLMEQISQEGAVIGALVAGDRRGEDPDVGSIEIQLVHAAAGFLGLFHQNAFRFAEQRQQFLGTLNALSASVDAKDPYTQGHSQRVGLLASQTAAKLGLDSQAVEAFRVAGLLHDIGKIGVPEAVLRKPARLTDEEFELIKQHPEIGYRILKDLPSLQFHIQGVLHHHERWDGRGYPHGLSGESIPLVARILALSDTFDAMSSNRSYRVAVPRSRVLDEIRNGAGTQFDPQMVELFTQLNFQAFDEKFVEHAKAA